MWLVLVGEPFLVITFYSGSTRNPFKEFYQELIVSGFTLHSFESRTDPSVGALIFINKSSNDKLMGPLGFHEVHIELVLTALRRTFSKSFIYNPLKEFHSKPFNVS